MSPGSQQAHKRNTRYQRSSSIWKLARLEENEVTLDSEQNEEMCTVVEAIPTEELEKLFQEGEQHGAGSLMKNVWFTDKDRQRKEFSQDQERNSKALIGYCLCILFIYCDLEANEGYGNRWNMITIRMGRLEVIIFYY